MKTLKRCPFCGHAGAATIEGGDRWYVVCGNPHCFCALGEIYDPCAMPDHHFAAEADAISAWNRRPHAKKDIKGRCNCKAARRPVWTCPVHGNVSQ